MPFATFAVPALKCSLSWNPRAPHAAARNSSHRNGFNRHRKRQIRSATCQPLVSSGSLSILTFGNNPFQYKRNPCQMEHQIRDSSSSIISGAIWRINNPLSVETFATIGRVYLLQRVFDCVLWRVLAIQPLLLHALFPLTCYLGSRGGKFLSYKSCFYSNALHP